MDRSVGMPMNVPVLMTGIFRLLGWNNVDVAVPDARFGNERIGKAPDGFDGAPQEHRLETIVAVHMRMHLGDHQIPVLVLKFGKPHRELPLMMVVDVARDPNAERSRRRVLEFLP